MSTGIHTTSARVFAATAALAKASSAYMALGSGNTGWGSGAPPAPSVNSTALLAEFCRRKTNLVQFCTPNSSGSISLPEGKFEPSTNPTNFVYFKFHFEFEDAVGSTIREMGVFLDTVPVVGIPAGQYLLTPAQVAQQGTMISVIRIPPMLREATKRELFEWVVTF